MECKYSYYVIRCEENGKYYSFAEKIENNNNLISYFARFKTAVSINACKTYKEAKRILECWNYCDKQNGTYLF